MAVQSSIAGPHPEIESSKRTFAGDNYRTIPFLLRHALKQNTVLWFGVPEVWLLENSAERDVQIYEGFTNTNQFISTSDITLSALTRSAQIFV